MKVRFSAEALNNAGCHHVLDQIISLFFSGRHAWDLSTPEGIAQSEWITSDPQGRAGRRNNEAYQKFTTDTIYQVPGIPSLAHRSTINIVIRPTAPDHVVCQDAIRYLTSPAYIVLENAAADGGFIDTLMAKFERRMLSDAQSDGWWTYRHAGGTGEFGKRIDEIRAVTPGPMRVIAIADSDAEFPGHLPRKLSDLQQACADRSVKLLILRKREIENYIPPSLLLKLLNGPRRTVAEELARLSPEQRDHYDMKSGFPREPDGSVQVSPSQTALYASLSNPRQQRLAGGFGAIASFFVERREHFTADLIRINCTDRGKELDDILNEIESLI